LSLLLQLISLALLLLAIAQLRLGSPQTSSRDHVVVLDTSSWMGARAGQGTLLDEARAKARAYVRAVPSTDRVMLIRADGLATPATGFERDKRKLDAAIAASRVSASALDLQQALSFAEQVHRLHSSRRGELVFIGAGRTYEEKAVQPPPGLRVIPVGSKAENAGLTKIGLRRSATDPAVWEFFAAVHNYGSLPKRIPLAAQFGGAPVGGGILMVRPNETQEITFNFRTRAAGWFETRILVNDALPDDDRAILELPALKRLRLAVYSDRPEILRPIFAANAAIEPVYRSPAEYNAKIEETVVLLDRIAPPVLPNAAVILIEPPKSGPVQVRAVVNNAAIVKWRADHELGAGLRSKQERLDTTQVFTPSAQDTVIAEVAEGPVILARSRPRMIILGFHPGSSALKFDLATPLLFANIFRWLQPDVFRGWELHGGSVGAVTVPLEADTDPSRLRVVGEDQRELPFTLGNRSLRFYAGRPGPVRVVSDRGEQVYSLALPEIGTTIWEPPASVKRGLPSRLEEVLARDLWPLLAILGTLGLIAEWLLYGRARRAKISHEPLPAVPTMRKAS
jgi:hypothetical protein